MSNKSKNKGKGFERQVAALFTDALGGCWMRVPNSGAGVGGVNAYRLVGMDNQMTRIMSGDIIVPQKYFGLEIECKVRAAFNFAHLFREEGNKELEAWIDQAWQHNPRVGLLVFKANNTPVLVCYPYLRLAPIGRTAEQVLCYRYKEQDYYIHRLSTEWLKASDPLLVAPSVSG